MWVAHTTIALACWGTFLVLAVKERSQLGQNFSQALGAQVFVNQGLGLRLNGFKDLGRVRLQSERLQFKFLEF